MTIEPPAEFRSNIVHLPLSKSIANRLLVMAFISENENLVEIPDSDDSHIMWRLLQELRQNIPDESQAVNSSSLSGKFINTYNAGDAGTVFRFLSALFAIVPGERILTGSARMEQRPIKPLIDALKELGANCRYLKNEGFPPVHFSGKKLRGGEIEIDSSISSQFVSSLMMIAPAMETGLRILLKGKQVSRPYIDLTAGLMKNCGINIESSEYNIYIEPGTYSFGNDLNESDWSAASYWYAMVSMIRGLTVKLSGLNPKSLQGDSVLVSIYKKLGITSEWNDNILTITNDGIIEEIKEIDLTQNPDLAPAIAVTCAALQLNIDITGLQTLIIKESNRLEAICKNLVNLGFKCKHNGVNMIVIRKGRTAVLTNIIDSFNDHRIAMSMSLLSVFSGNLIISNPSCVNKSYRSFWKDLQLIGFNIREF